MSSRKIAALALAGLVTAVIGATVVAQDAMIDPAIADMSVEELVDARKAAMKENGGVLRSAGTLTGADATAAAEKLIENFANFPALFAEGSITDNSKALPVIWEQKEDFDAISAAALEKAMSMKAAAEAGDAAAFAATAQEIGPLCGQCHTTYRAS